MKVCGKVIGYQVSSPDAFAVNPLSSSVDDVYVNGISVTHGAHPRKHIWTFAAGVTEGPMNSFHPSGDCPCVQHNQVYSAPTFIGNNYYCESGNPHRIWRDGIYSNDLLWDGEDCEGQCCSN